MCIRDRLWLYDRLAMEPDRANRRALLLQRNATHGDAALWNLVRSVTHLPLLDHWNEVVLDVFRQNDWIRPLRGIQVDAVFVDLGSDAVEVEISRLVREGRLTLDTKQPASLCQAA